MESSKFGAYLRRLRLSRGLTQTDLAKMLQVHPSQVSQWENAFRSPSGRSLARLSEAFGTDLRKWFLTSRDTEAQTPPIGVGNIVVTVTFNNMPEETIKEILKNAGVPA